MLVAYQVIEILVAKFSLKCHIPVYLNGGFVAQLQFSHQTITVLKVILKNKSNSTLYFYYLSLFFYFNIIHIDLHKLLYTGKYLPLFIFALVFSELI